MSSFLIFHSTVKDPAKFQQYAQAVGPTLGPFGGTVALRGKVSRVLTGDHEHQAVGILRFPTRENAIDWYRSEAYQDLLAVRDESADLTVIRYDEPV